VRDKNSFLVTEVYHICWSGEEYHSIQYSGVSNL